MLGYDDATERELYVVECDDVARLPSPLRVPAPHWVCLVAGDTVTLTEAAIHRLAASLLGGGAVEVALWGRGAERAHGLVTDAVLMHETSQAEERLVMTSWHHEPLDETLLFFLRETVPSLAYREACRAGVVVALAGAPLAEIRRVLAAPLEHVARMTGDPVR